MLAIACCLMLSVVCLLFCGTGVACWRFCFCFFLSAGALAVCCLLSCDGWCCVVCYGLLLVVCYLWLTWCSLFDVCCLLVANCCLLHVPVRVYLYAICLCCGLLVVAVSCCLLC